MENKVVETHNFNEAKEKINRFSGNIPSYVRLTKSKTDGGLFGWFDHTVTGEELNKLVGEIQEKFIQNNQSIKDIICEFKEIYNAFEALDKDYITGILVSLDKASKAQKDVDISIDAIQQTIEALKKHKSQTMFDISEINSKLETMDYLFQQMTNFILQNKEQTDLEFANMKKNLNIIDQSADSQEESILNIKELESLSKSLSTKKIERCEEKSINRKIFYAYLVSGCSLFLTLLHLVMTLIGVF